MMLPEQDKQDAYNCPSCGSIRECILDQIPSTASYIISFMSIFLFGIWSLFIIPLIFQSTKIIVKRCYYCNTEIERQKFFAIPSLSDSVLQFKFGNCMIVLSRKYALILLVLFICAFCYFEIFIQQPPLSVDEVQHQRIVIPWLSFLELCGKYQIIDNGLRAKMHFEKEFHGKIIDWSGFFNSLTLSYYVSSKRNYDPVHPYSDLIYIKMDPTESQDDFPDLILGISSHLSSQIKAQVSAEPQGRKLQFQAIFESVGNDFNYHILTLKSLQVLKEREELTSLAKYKQIVAQPPEPQITQEAEPTTANQETSPQAGEIDPPLPH